MDPPCVNICPFLITRWLPTARNTPFSYESTLITKRGKKLLKFLMLIKEKKVFQGASVYLCSFLMSRTESDE